MSGNMKSTLVPIFLAAMASGAMAQSAVAATFDFTPTADCTMTVVSVTGAPLPPAGWKPTWTYTKHTKTETIPEPVDCGGCRNLVTATLFIDFYYPEVKTQRTVEVTAAEPTTVVDFVCSRAPRPTSPPQLRAIAKNKVLYLPDQPFEAPDAAVDQSGLKELVEEESAPVPAPETNLADRVLAELGMPAIPIVKRGRKRDLCTKLLLQLPQFTFGPTRTEWTETETFTESIDCSGCPNLVHSFLPLGVPPVAIFTTTTTAGTPTTTTVFACLESTLALPEETFAVGPAATPETTIPAQIDEEILS
jgi:hypothetical protein